MNFSFVNRLPYLDETYQVPQDSAVRVLLKSSDDAPAGKGRNALEFLSAAQSMKSLGYLRTALTYHALGIKDDATHCLLLEQDGFARETHAILTFGKSRNVRDLNQILVAHNPDQKVWFSVGLGSDGQRFLAARSANQEAILYREEFSPLSSGVLTAVDRWYESSFSELCEIGSINDRRQFNQLASPSAGQLDLFAEC